MSSKSLVLTTTVRGTKRDRSNNDSSSLSRSSRGVAEVDVGNGAAGHLYSLKTAEYDE